MNRASKEGLARQVCPNCGNGASTLVLTGRDYLHDLGGTFTVAECSGCGLWYQNPKPAPDVLLRHYPEDYSPHVSSDEGKTAATSLSLGYARMLKRYYGYVDLEPPFSRSRRLRELGFLAPLRIYSSNRKLVPYFVPGGRLLEIGCASGLRLLHFQRLGWKELYGIELVPDAATRAQALGFRIECGRAEEIIDAYPDGFFDVVFATMVIEHIADPFGFVRKVAQKMKKGGQFLFSTVTRSSIDAKIYGGYWAGFDFPRHLVYLRDRDIREILRKGFRDARFYYQSAFIDFARSSEWRLRSGTGNLFDKAVARLGNSVGEGLAFMISLFRRSSRVSIRCTKT
jgi:SAM-dependent methyltransferase